LSTLLQLAIDNAPYNDTYYRLRTIDFSGSESLSDIAYLRQAQSHIGAITIYPSPTTGITHLAFTSHSEGTVSIKVFDITGRNVLAQMAPIQEGMNSMVTDLTGMNSGIYTMIVSTDTDLPLQVKVVKQ
jgi:hypothetical protein